MEGTFQDLGLFCVTTYDIDVNCAHIEITVNRTVMVTVIVHHLSYVTVMEQLPTVIPMSAYRRNCYG